MLGVITWDKDKYVVARTIKVRDATFEMLRKLKEERGFNSMDETITYLLKVHRSARLNKTLGVDRGRITSFTREDRAEDRFE